MKKIIYILLTIVTFCSCETKNATVDTTPYEINGCKLKIFVIDSCEYIGNIYGSNTDAFTHKGNCRFCIARNKK